ncbi:hypothetical protein [Polyangium spumosum]|uniref:Lipoprotein n=1 Tax=Polyangium spumosum TaxID=889282 RepID=A0A6N7Q2G3_9BACT|nr:hypothetical protein [Polyangium spumosum]MRG98528.1 hypothetical protein [Polyangium spumosum]
MNTRAFSLLLALSLTLAACNHVRQTTPLAYAGDGRTTVASLDAAIQKRGYRAICKEREYCKFQPNPEVWVHFKATADRVVMAVDLLDGKKMPADKQKALTDEATTLGQAIWAEASADAGQRERAAAERERVEEEAERREEERRAAEAKARGSESGGGIGGLLGTASDVLGGIKTTESGQSNTTATAQSSASAHCCINRAYYQCPSAAAVNKCAGESAACLTRCMMGGGSGCGERCMKEHPPDPSDCQRQPEKDGQCK